MELQAVSVLLLTTLLSATFSVTMAIPFRTSVTKSYVIRALTSYQTNCTNCYRLKTYFMETGKTGMEVCIEKDQEVEMGDPNSPCYAYPIEMESLPIGRHLPRFIAVIVGQTTPMVGQYRTLWYFDYFMSKAKRVPFSNNIVLAHRFIVPNPYALSQVYLDWVEQGVTDDCQLNLHHMRLHVSQQIRSVAPLAKDHMSTCISMPHRIYLFGTALVSISMTNLYTLELDAVNDKLLLHVWKRDRSFIKFKDSVKFVQRVMLDTFCPVDSLEEIRHDVKYLQHKLIARINCSDGSYFYFMHDTEQSYTLVQRSPIGIFDNVMIYDDRPKRYIESFINTDNEAIVKYKGVRMSYISNNKKLEVDLINSTIRTEDHKMDMYGNALRTTIFSRPNFIVN